MMVFKNKTIFIVDATANIEPTAEELAEIAMLTAEKVRQLDVEPRIAMLSFSNFGSTKHPLTEKVRNAVQIVKRLAPDLIIDGEVQADAAVVSTHRLSNQFYGLPQDDALVFRRLEKEVVHELGHTFGLHHCHHFECVMRSSTYVEEVDLKKPTPCNECSALLQKVLVQCCLGD